MAEARCLVSPARVFARPTADQIWLGPAQQTALSQLSRSIRLRLLVGPASSGKSTLLNHVAAQLGRRRRRAALPGPEGHRARGAFESPARRGSRSLGALGGRADGTCSPSSSSNAVRRANASSWSSTTRTPTSRPRGKRSSGCVAFKIEKRGAIELLLAGPPALAQRIEPLRATLVAKEFDACSLFPPSDQELASYIEWRLARFEMADLITPTPRR